MANNLENVRVPLQEQQRLVRRSERLLRLGWKIGPLEGQRACCAKSAEEMGEARVGDNPLTLSQMTTPYNRCRSIVCRPGDPYGCSMVHARKSAAGMTTIVGGWQQAGHAAYVCLLEVRGASDQSLKSTLDTARVAMNRTTGGGTWSNLKAKREIVGQISALDVTKATSGGWVARRWLLLMGERDLASDEVQQLSEKLRTSWSLSIEESGKSFAARSLPLRRIDPAETKALTQFIVRCNSPFEPPEEPFATSYRYEFAPHWPEETAVELSERYRTVASELKPIFDSAGREEYIAMRNDVFGYKTSLDGREPSFRAIELPQTAWDFMEYAVRLFQVRTWTAEKKRHPEGAGILWNSLLVQANAVKYQYIEYEYDVSKRKFKKV